MKMQRRLIALVAAVTLPCVAQAQPAIDYRDPPQGTFRDDWLVVELTGGDFAGGKAGYAHNTVSRDGDVITSRMLMVLRIGRLDQPIEISVLNTVRETVDGKALSFDSTTKMGTVDMTSKGKISDGKVRLESGQFGKLTRQVADFPANAKMVWGTYLASLEHGFDEGTSYTLDIYEPSVLTSGSIKAHTTVGKKTKIELNGQSVDAVEVTTTMSLSVGEIPSTGYVDETGNILRAETAMAGFNMVMAHSDRRTALKDFEPPEFFVDTLIEVKKEINRDTANRIIYTLSVKGDDQKIPTLPTTAMQTPGERTKQRATVTVQRIDYDALLTAKPVNPDRLSPEIREYLLATPTLNSRDDAVIEMAKQAADGETQPYKIADKLRVYVSRIIRDKNLNIGFATASEVCRKREGDCTEHGVLLAALGRVLNIPSRVVVGIAYVPNFAGKRHVFGFHMWTQFYIAEQWIDFDAALQESECNPGRIVLATSSLKDFGVGEIAFAIVDIITGLDIEITEIQHR